MRFDMLDEYATLVPFGLGISKHNRVVRSPATPTEADKPDVIAKRDSRLKILFRFVKALGQIGGRKAAY